MSFPGTSGYADQRPIDEDETPVGGLTQLERIAH